MDLKALNRGDDNWLKKVIGRRFYDLNISFQSLVWRLQTRKLVYIDLNKVIRMERRIKR